MDEIEDEFFEWFFQYGQIHLNEKNLDWRI